ncbi:ImmA/IrrE family metallo-endopeptidase [Nocardioides zeae]|uniref:Uncharacterized protein n=1 Tax=Nocardioides zeae TaxID=1457234 RepID=A0A6P0HGF8_9ACTN|nr:hypothetical protein [Nocardioides zeae]NEN76785.1 hypothetical protein [Nocardioides zeae]
MMYRVLINHATKPVPQRRQDHGRSLRVPSSRPTFTKAISECDDWTEFVRPSGKADPNPWSPRLAMERLGLEEIAFPVEEGDNCFGFVEGDQVAIRPNAPFPLNTLFHELGHFVLGHSFERSGPKDSRSLQEVMAETVAFSMMAMVGAVSYDSLSSSWFYVANWSSGMRRLTFWSPSAERRSTKRSTRCGEPASSSRRALGQPLAVGARRHTGPSRSLLPKNDPKKVGG